MIRKLLALPLLLLAPAAALAQAVPPEAAPIKAHVQFLASDALRGREAGTRDFDIAAEYVASQMLALGLKPAGEDGGWFQKVPLVSYRAGDPGTMQVTRGAKVEKYTVAVDYMPLATPAMPDLSVSGAMVFAGYGIVDPQTRRDDYKGLDVRGKIVVLIEGVPEGLSNEVAAHLGDWEAKAHLAELRGAKGVILIESVKEQDDTPFEEYAAYWRRDRMDWASPKGVAHTASPGAPPFVYFGMKGAEKLFAGSKVRWADVVAAQRTGKRVPTGALAGTFAGTGKTFVRMLESHNVVGVLEGSDPALKGQYVVLSAHLDHVGVGGAGKDRIFNGAMDNAIGVASILEVARRFSQSGTPPRRSILFIALTAEEKGLLGSGYFANYPTVPKDALVADINLDMPIMTYPVVDLVAQGAERSSLGPIVAHAAKEEGLGLVPDPMPEEMFFVRSDHYSFVQAGIPAVSIDTGPGGEGAVAIKDFLDKHYHQPSDDITLPFNWETAIKFVGVNYRVARAVADADARPRWNKGDFFGVLFDGYGAK